MIKHKSIPINSGSGSKFILPKKSQIFGNKSTQLSSSPLSTSLSPTFNKLSDLANFHLQNSVPESIDATTSIMTNLSISPKFVIPKLNGTFSTIQKCNINNNTNLTPHELSLKKIIHMKNNYSGTTKISQEHLMKNETNLSPKVIDDENQFVIDLSSALRQNDKIPIESPMKSIDIEEFTPKFIDCELSTINHNLLTMITNDCEIDSSSILVMPIRRVTKKRSKFGKILCTKYRCNRKPIVSHDFKQKHVIEPFWFGRPSPDDIILEQLKKLKR